MVRHPLEFVEKVRYVAELDPLRSWFFYSLWDQDGLGRRGVSPVGTYWEFGVGQGGSLTRYLQALGSLCRIKGRDPKSYAVVGFDTFTGLPPSRDKGDELKGWQAGMFASSQEEVLRYVGKRVDLGLFTTPTWIAGRFDATLTPALREKLAPHPPAIVTIDVDQYSSAREVLEWLRPLLASGTLFYFDDIWDFHGHLSSGEIRAIREFNEVGNGTLTPFAKHASPPLSGKTYVYARKDFEYRS